MRKLKINLLLTLFFTLLYVSGFAQIFIEFPVERTVFQRDNSNTGLINIFGNVSSDCDRVEARLIPRSEGQGVATSWITIDSKVEGNAYIGKIQHKGGWYKLEVRGVKDEKVLFTSNVERVGIGEVFVIAGQSNAQGDGTNVGAKAAIDDRVNAYAPNYYLKSGDYYKDLPEILDNISFTKINNNTNIGPGGFTPWCYGELGDLLVARLNVPVMFFNAAYSGTSTQNWVQSIRNEPTQHAFFPNNLPLGYPYKTLKVTLQSINTLLGIRSILWHQGEFDAALYVSQQSYYNNLQYIINETRTNIGKDIPWMVSRATRYYGFTSPTIIAAQNQVIKNSANVWAGPETDNIQPYRYDNAHFQNSGNSQGLTELAHAWNASLSEAFFTTSQAVLPQDIVPIRPYCLNDHTVRLTLDNSFREYNWSNQSHDLSIDVSSGMQYATTRDAKGNVFRTNTVVVNNVRPHAVPVILTPDGLLGCEGKSIELKTKEYKYGVVWENGSSNPTQVITASGNYSAKYKTQNNCYSASSQTANVTFIPPPLKPTLTFLDGGGFKCDGEKITVAISNVQGADIKWSTGETTNHIKLSDNRFENITATLYSLPNCPSPPSDKVVYSFYENPKVPSINYDGPFYLTAKSDDKVDSFNWFFANSKIDNSSRNFIHIDKIGSYMVNAEKNYHTPNGSSVTCISPNSTAFTTKENSMLKGYSVFPNPTTDGLLKITSDGIRENVNLELYDEKGRKVYQTHIDKLSFPYQLDLRSKSFSGKFFLVLKYETQSRTFPLVFVR